MKNVGPSQSTHFHVQFHHSHYAVGPEILYFENSQTLPWLVWFPQMLHI